MKSDKDAPKKGDDYYSKWYKDNKKSLLAERKRRYRNDPEYRRQMRLNARLRREEVKRQEAMEKPEGCVHLLKDVCEGLDYSTASFHTMVSNGYIPNVTVWKRKAYLTDTQKDLLERLVQSIADKDRKALSHPSPETEAVLDEIQTNW